MGWKIHVNVIKFQPDLKKWTCAREIDCDFIGKGFILNLFSFALFQLSPGWNSSFYRNEISETPDQAKTSVRAE